MYRSCIWENVAFLLLSAPFLDWIGARKHVGLLAFPQLLRKVELILHRELMCWSVWPSPQCCQRTRVPKQPIRW